MIWLLFVLVYDLRERRVPNWLVLSGAVLALAVLAFGAQPFGIGWAAALMGAAVGLGFLLLFYATGLMGAGDVKFAAALGLWVGLQSLAAIWVVASLLAGAHAVLWLILRRWPWFPRLAQMLSSGQRAVASDGDSRQKARFIPYAAYLALATAVWMVWGRQG